MWQKVGWQSKTTFCHQAQYTVHWHTLWTQWACSNSKFWCGKGWYLLYLVMVVLNIAKAAVFAHSRCIQIKADVLNWMAKGRVFICNSNGNSQLCRKCIIMSISAFASNSGQSMTVTMCKGGKCLIDLPPSHAAIRPSTLIGGTSLMSSIGDFLLVSCNK